MLRILIVAVVLTTVCVPGRCAVNQRTDKCIEGIDVSNLNQDLKKYIYNGVEAVVNGIEAFKTQVEMQLKDSNDKTKKEMEEMNTKYLSSEKRVIALQKTIQEKAARQNRINAENSRKVAVTSCVQSSKRYSSHAILKFSNVKMSSGVTKIYAFKSTGIFTCEYPGLYHVTVTMSTSSSDTLYGIIMKNNMQVVTSYDAVSNNLHTSTAAATLILDINDTVYMKSFGSFWLYGGSSCMSITKIK